MGTNESAKNKGKDRHGKRINIEQYKHRGNIGASCHKVVLDSRSDLGAEHSGNPPIVSSLNLHHSISGNRGPEASSIGTKKLPGPRPQFMNYYHLMNIFLSELSQTQTLITHISRLCQEIRDIKRQNKNCSNSTPKAEPRCYLEYRRRRLWTATSARTIQALMKRMAPVILALLTIHHLPILNTVMTPHHVMEHLIHPCIPHYLKAIKSSLLPNPTCHPTILSYQPHPLPLLRIPRHHLLCLIP